MNLDIYFEYGAQLFPLRPRKFIGDADCKRPLVEDCLNRKFSKEQIADYYKKGHAIGWALSETDLVIDVDIPTAERPGKRGHESLKSLAVVLGDAIERHGVEVTSPNGGRHFYFTKPANLAVRKTKPGFPDIDFLSKGSYVVIAGSPHWQGGNYHFDGVADVIGDYTRKPAPQTLLTLIKKEWHEAEEGETPEAIPAELLERMLAELDASNYQDHDVWFKLLCASHSAVGGTPEGLKVFRAWSTSDPKYQGAGAEIGKRWRSLDHKSGGYTIASLFDELKRVGRGDVIRLVSSQMDFSRVETADKPRIKYDLDETKVNNAVVSALTGATNLFQRAGMLVSVGDTGIVPVTPLVLCEIASSVCSLVEERQGKQGPIQVPIRIPARVGQQISQKGSWFGIPRLKAIVTTPVLTNHGVLQTPGYDLKSGVYYKKTIEVPAIPESPTQEQAKAALDRLADIVVDFPFRGPAHRSSWLAGLLSVFARPAIDGPVPIFLVDGNQAGVGKSLLVNTVSLIAYGKDIPNGKLSSDDEEVAKTLMSIALANHGLYCFDNLENGGDFGCASLDSVLTSRSVRGRLLGQSKIVDAEIDTVFFATGNRVAISKDSDSFRRIAFINLVCEDSDPKSRSDFKHGSNDAEFVQWVMANRPTFIVDALTVLQAAWRTKELPDVKPWGSYAGFSEIVRKALVWLGYDDPLKASDDAAIFNEDADQLSAVVEGLRIATGGERMTVANIYAKLSAFADGLGEANETRGIVTTALEALAPSNYKNPAMALAKRLRSQFRDRPCGGYWIKAERDPHLKQLVYYVEPVSDSVT